MAAKQVQVTIVALQYSVEACASQGSAARRRDTDRCSC